MKRTFGLFLALALAAGTSSVPALAQTTTQQVQQKAGAAGDAVATAAAQTGAATQETVAHPEQHTKRWIAIGVVVLLLILLMLALARRRKRSEKVITTRQG